MIVYIWRGGAREGRGASWEEGGGRAEGRGGEGRTLLPVEKDFTVFSFQLKPRVLWEYEQVVTSRAGRDLGQVVTSRRSWPRAGRDLVLPPHHHQVELRHKGGSTFPGDNLTDLLFAGWTLKFRTMKEIIDILQNCFFNWGGRAHTQTHAHTFTHAVQATRG